MKKLLTSLLLLGAFATCFSQAKIRKFSASINNPSINVWAPFISLDGSAILFTSDYADANSLIYFSQREGGDWKLPVDLPKHLNNRLHLMKGYTLSPDGKVIYMTSIKSGGVGGYDMWSSEQRGIAWGELVNLYAPLNSKLHEGCPTFTPDGNTMYFMRCEKMDVQKADKCKIFVTRKNAVGQWETPTELPAHINTGNSQTPRIMADGETLIFASDKFLPNKGGMDLYVTKLNGGEWSPPVALDLVNTETDDQYVSAQANGRYLLKEAPGKFRSEIVEYLLPDEIRPRGVMKVEGVIKDGSGAPTQAYISVTNALDGKRTFSGRPGADGYFFFFLTEGNVYELSVDHADGNYTYYSKTYDLTGNALLRNDKLNIVLKPLAAGDELELDALRFKPNSAVLETAASEMRRLSRLIKNYSQFTFEIQVLLAGYLEDSVQSSPDLTEMVVDSSYVTYEDIDTLGQLITRDSLIIKRNFHNDRTEKQANAIVEQLVAAGVDPSSLTIFVNARPEEVAENRRTVIKLLARQRKR